MARASGRLARSMGAGLAQLRQDEADRGLRRHFVLVDHGGAFGDAFAGAALGAVIVGRVLPAAARAEIDGAVHEGARGLDHHFEALAHRERGNRLGEEFVDAGVAARDDHLAGEARGDQDDGQAADAVVFACGAARARS